MNQVNPSNSYLPEINEGNLEIKIEDEPIPLTQEDVPLSKEDVPLSDDHDIEEEEEEEEVVEIKPKKKLTQTEIFKPPKIQQVISTVTGKPKKKMTEKQLAHLKTIRAKGLETRKRNKKLRDEGKAVEISKKMKNENTRIKEKIVVEKEKISNVEIENITFNAIHKYEIMRKARKEEKKKKLEIENEKNKHMEVVNKQLNSALRRSTGSMPDIWEDSLKGMWS